VERKARPIRVEKVEVLEVALPHVTFRVTCSAGTYVRSLCQTLGEALGTGGCLQKLERTQVGPFSLKDSLTLDEVKRKMEQGKLSGMLLPASRLVEHFPEVKLKDEDLMSLCRGRNIENPKTFTGLCRVLNEKGFLSAIADATPEGRLKPKKVLGMEGVV